MTPCLRCHVTLTRDPLCLGCAIHHAIRVAAAIRRDAARQEAK